MRTQIKFFAFSAAFSLAVAVTYWLLSSERAGSTFLLFMFLAPLLIGGFLALRGWRARSSEDDPDASIQDEAGAVVGRFSSPSAWPLVLAIGFSVGLEGFVFGVWLLVSGAAMVLLAVVGLMNESGGGTG